MSHLQHQSFLNMFCNNYFVPIFSVHRTQEFLEDLDHIELQYESFDLELTQSFLSVLRGKSKCLKNLYLVRQVHEARKILLNNTEIKNKIGNDWIFLKNKFINFIFSEIEIIEKINISQRDVLRKNIDNFIESKGNISLKIKRNFIKNFFKYIKYYFPFLIIIINKIRSQLYFFIPIRKKLTKHNLLNKKSIHYRSIHHIYKFLKKYEKQTRL